jgi:hypothetical protein
VQYSDATSEVGIMASTTNNDSPAQAPDAASLATTYFRAWTGRDFATLRSILADDVTFNGPLGTAVDADGAMRGLRGMAEIITDLRIEHRFVDGQDVLTWFEMHTRLAPPCSVANWSRVENGRITRIRVIFDARELAAAMASSAPPAPSAGS